MQKPLITIHLYSAKLSQARAEPYRLALPALDEELEQAAEELGLDEITGASIVTVEIGDTTLKELIPMECSCVEDANHLAMSIEELRQREDLYLKYLAVISVEQPQTMEAGKKIPLWNKDGKAGLPESLAFAVIGGEPWKRICLL